MSSSAPILIDSDSDEIVVATPHLRRRRKRKQLSQVTSNKKVATLARPDTPAGDQLPTPESLSDGDTKLYDRFIRTASEEQVFEEDDSSSIDGEIKRGAKPLRRIREVSHVAATGPGFPRSEYEGCTPPATACSEAEAHEILQAALKSGTQSLNLDASYTYFQLNEFCIYRPEGTRWAKEIVCLDRLTQARFSEFRFNGVLSVGNQKCYVQNVPFQILTIDGYGHAGPVSVEREICIQSVDQARARSRNGVWYQLGRPSTDYRRFYQEFLWLAQFTKYFVNYLIASQQVTLSHFKTDFYKWLPRNDAAVQRWLEATTVQTTDAVRPRTRDFRTLVTANVAFLWKECWDIDDRATGLCRHPLWEEIDPQRLKAIPAQLNKELKTVVTPYAFECFRDMYFGDQLAKRSVSDKHTLAEGNERKAQLGLTPGHSQRASIIPRIQTPHSGSAEPPQLAVTISAGDVVCVEANTDTAWQSTADIWYAYVQQVRYLPDRTLLDVLWLYEPGDTIIGKAYYPFANELFLSDNCSCGKDALDLECVLKKVDIAWHAKDPYRQRGLFIRQKFRTIHEKDTYDFVALGSASDFRCQCLDATPIFEECLSKYNIADTVLVREWSELVGEDRLEPAYVLGFDRVRQRINLRRMHRRGQVDPAASSASARPNELLLSEDTFDVPPSRIIRKCHVHYFTGARIAAGEVVTPYDRDGAGDLFYIASQVVSDGSPLAEDEVPHGSLTNNEDYLPPIRQGWNPAAQAFKPKLTGMGIFCGGGSFDRGLEEGGAVHFRYAVDWAEHALHSYRANAEPNQVQYFLGSVNDYLAQALAGIRKPIIARPGDFNFLSAGSPCPGFSALQMFKLSEESKRNASMVASVVSFVDFYAPEYFILENVVTMTYGMGPNKDQNVFSQIIAALVGLGYQVQQFLMDAWSYGSPQQRSRVFIIASAPGLTPLSPPPHTHEHPPGTGSRALGRSSNGLPFGSRRDEYTTFDHATPAQACRDLPSIDNAQVQLCVSHPDHRTATEESAIVKARMAVVPTRPHGMGLMQAHYAGLLRGEPEEYCQRVNPIRRMKTSKLFSRIKPSFLFPTLITKLPPGDGLNGRVLHWEEHRTITVLEARRAQGYPDHEVIVGCPSQQLKIVGNSIDRKVALVLGLALRESWESSRILLPAHNSADIDADRTSHEDVSDDANDETTVPATALADALMLSRREDTSNQPDESAELHGDDNDDPEEIESEDRLKGSRDIDNRSAKIALHLSPEEIEEIRRDQFKAIRRILEERG